MNTQPCVFIIDDDDAVRDSLGMVVETYGLDYRTFESAEHFLENYSPDQLGCLLLDMNLPGLNGDELQIELIRRNIHLPIIFITAYGTIPMTVRAMKAGAVDFLTKPVSKELLIERIQDLLVQASQMREQALKEQALSDRLKNLTARELEILPLLLAGNSNKQIGKQLAISYRTVEVHRARILNKTGASNLVDLAHFYEASQLLPDPKIE